MKKKVFLIFLIFMFLGILAYHFNLNLKEILQPPSEEWSREKLITTGNIKCAPKITRWNDTYLIAYNDGETVKIIQTDLLGEKLKEQTIALGKEEISNIGIMTDKKSIYINWVTSVKEKKELNTAILTDAFSIKGKSKISDIKEAIQLDNTVLAIEFKDRIEVKDIEKAENYVVSIKDPDLISGTKVKGEYIIAYRENVEQFSYFTIKDGQVSVPKLAGKLPAIIRIGIGHVGLVSDGNTVSMFVEYSYLSEFGKAYWMRFSLKQEDYTCQKFWVGGEEERYISNVTSPQEFDKAAFFADIETRYNAKKEYVNVAELDLNPDKTVKIVPVSRTRDLTLYSSVQGETAIFCDLIGEGKINLYMASKNLDFKAAASKLKKSDITMAAVNTIDGLIVSIIEILSYGVMWIIPMLSIAALLTFIEYKVKDQLKKKLFIINSFLLAFIKCYFIYAISYKRLGQFLPKELTPGIGLSIACIISLASCIMGYIKYSENLEGNILATSFAFSIALDTMLTLSLFAPFII